MNFKTKTKPPQLTSWSFSRYGDWRACPLKAKLKHIDKMKEPKSAAMDRGITVHNLAEGYIKGTEKKLAPELVSFKDEFARLRKLYKQKALPVIVEDNWALDAQWNESRWDDWVNCWVRIKLDCAHWESPTELVVTDWKTGKPNSYKMDEYLEQLELYAVAALALLPHLERVQVRLAFTDVGEMFPKEAPKVYERKDFVRLRNMWSKRVAPMMNDTSFVAKPNATCKWCWFGESGKAKGGPGLCKY